MIGLGMLVSAASPTGGSATACDRVPLCEKQVQAPVHYGALDTKGCYPPEITRTITNWCVKHETITVTLGCSAEPQEASCPSNSTSKVIKDPGCPVQGTVQNSCSSGVVPVCIQTWTEQCADGPVLHRRPWRSSGASRMAVSESALVVSVELSGAAFRPATGRGREEAR